MIEVFHARAPIIILYAVTLHYVWSILGFFSPDAYNATALRAIFDLFGYYTPIPCFLVATSALIGLRMPANTTSLALMIPQQMLLMLSAFGAVHAIAAGHFADGVVRPQTFIASDQVPAIIAAIGHTISIVQRALRRS